MSQVACIHCNAMIDITRADLTGRGYRCTQCSLKASLAADGGRNDISDHLTPEERVARAKAAASEMVFGSVIAALGVAVFIGFSGVIGVAVFAGGAGAMSHGYLTRREMTGERTS
jgi:hypothetical protein